MSPSRSKIAKVPDQSEGGRSVRSFGETPGEPPHPGRIVKDDCLPELKLSVGAAAAAHGVSRQTLDKIINGRSGITPDTAIRFEKIFGSSAEAWLRMQLAYDLAQARIREKETVATMRAVAA